MFAPKPRQPQQAIVNRKLHAKRATQRIATEPRRQCRLCHRRCVQGFLRLASTNVQKKMNWSDQRNGPMFGHLVTTIREANEDMMFITEVRGRDWLDGKNLHMVCVDEFVFVIRGQFGIFLNRAVYKHFWQAVRMHSGPRMARTRDGWVCT